LILLEAAALLLRVGEFQEAVSQFQALQVEFEAFGHGFGTRANLGQGRLAGGIVADEGEPATAEIRLQAVGQEQIQPAVAVESQVLGARDSPGLGA
jgi:hypothetical protein